MRTGKRTIEILFGMLLLWAGTASGQNYVLTKILDSTTTRPDGQGSFAINAITTPSFDGQWVVFRDNGPADDQSRASIWSYNVATSTLRKLVDRDTVAPGGSGTLIDFQLQDSAPIVRRGTVIFLARDSSLGTNRQGIYAVPAGGGAVVKIADYNTANPTGGFFTALDVASKQTGGFSFDGSTLAFYAQGTGGTVGVYSAKPDGASLAVTADSKHPLSIQGNQVIAFSTPALGGSNVVMYGSTPADPKTGYNGLYLGKPGGNGALTELVNSNQQLPGNTNTAFHTRFSTSVLALDELQAAFRADDATSYTSANPTGYFGLYVTDLISHTITKVVDSASSVTGLGKLTAIADGGVSTSHGALLYRLAGASGNGLYLWKNGTAARIAGRGDTLDGLAVQDIADPGSSALFGASFVLNVDVGRRALYLARPATGTPALMAVESAADYGGTSLAPGEIVALFGAGLGPSTLTMGQFSANALPTSLASVRVLFNGTPAPLIYVSDAQTAAIVPFNVASLSTVQVTVEYNGVASNAITLPIANTKPAVFALDYTGSGQGAIQNADITYNGPANPAAPGSVVVLWITGLGQLNPAQADGVLVTSNPLPVLQITPTVTIGGQTAAIQYQGPAPYSVAGLYQINCVVPAGTPSGPAAVVVTADGRQSQPNLTVSVR